MLRSNWLAGPLTNGRVGKDAPEDPTWGSMLEGVTFCCDCGEQLRRVRAEAGHVKCSECGDDE